jgi:predicted metal-binding transcription factor (methanogenesis marker protein 9)
MTISHLADLKLAVIEYHINANDYAKTGMARDACFTSFNSLMWKRTGPNQMLDTASEIKSLLPERGTEVADVKLEKLLSRYELMEQELEMLTERHDADKEVYLAITGDIWSAKPKRTHTSDGLGLDARLAKFAA